MLKRNAYEHLLKWKDSTGKKKCLMVRGARQVGKTYLIRYFGEREYKNFIELNFLKKAELKHIFSGNLDIKSLLLNFSVYMPDVRFEDGKTLLFLDEIQECPEAITSLKFWAEDGRFDVVASGSMLGIDYKRPSSYPVGYVDYLDMTALGFGEFLLAAGINQDVLDLLSECFKKKTPVPDPVHQKIMDYLRIYIAVGGMPEVVQTYFDSGSVADADAVQRRILNDYRYDIAHYAPADVKIKAENCYFSLPSQLRKANHKFQYTIVEKGTNARKYGSSIDWIKQADLVISACNVDPLFAPLDTHQDNSDFRLYTIDIGLFTSMMDYSLKAQILNPTAENLSSDTKGGIYEALAADLLYKAGNRNLHFTKNAQGTFEIEFVLERPEGIIPEEVKSGRSRSKSLDNLLKKETIPYGYKLIAGNAGVAGKKITMPLYMAMFL